MPNILLIEDDDLLRPMLGARLRELGHTVTEARDGKEGLALHACSPATLVLTDLIMPEMEGMGTIMELQKKWPEVKIIAMSGGSRVTKEDYLPIARQMGAGAVLYKPFSIHELVAAIDALLPSAEK